MQGAEGRAALPLPGCLPLIWAGRLWTPERVAALVPAVTAVSPVVVRYGKVKRAERLLRARLAYTIARHSLRSLDPMEKLLLQVTRKNESKGYDRFRDRVMFPIRDTRGRTIAFGGRVLDGGEPKYLNSPETPLFQKGSELYGLFEARNALRDMG